jgi:WD40 repeat protein/tRNA A-37 threonylcarbamoyl transferase component Bud32
MVSSPLFCPVCGAANTSQALSCFACGQALNASSLAALPAQTGTTVLKSRYRLLHRLGQGGMGSVYKAEDSSLGNRLVAIKEMSQKGLNQQEASEATDAFKREALLLAGLLHPNLPRIYDHFSEHGRWYLVMDFIEGQTLEDYLTQKGGTLPLDEVLDIGIQLCNVLNYLHTRQPAIIFRDLKPANVMRTSDGQLYLIDFGIARHFKPGQAKDTIAFGSPGYAAPEQYGKAQTAPSADMYSLGVMLHQMLTGDDPSLKPFFFAPLSTRGPRRLQSLLNQLLDMDAGKRPDDALLVKQKIQEIAQQDLSVYGQPLPPVQPVQTPPQVPTYQPIQTVPTPPVQRPPIGEELITYTQHSDWIAAIAWSPDGNYIASASYDRTIQVWEPPTGNLKTLYAGHNGFWTKGRVNAVSWSPDSTCIVSGSDDKTAQIWDAQTGKLFFTYRDHHAGVIAISWSSNGEKIASASDVVAHVWDPSCGDILAIYSGFSRGVQTLSWSPDSTLLAIGVRDNVVYVYDYTKGQTDKQHAINYREHTDFVQSLAWSPDNKLIASASNDKTVRIWDPYTGRTLLTYKGHLYAVKAVAWSPDGTHIASTGADETVHIWDAQTGQLSFLYKGHFAVIYALAWSHAGRYVASGDAHNLIHVWRAV